MVGRVKQRRNWQFGNRGYVRETPIFVLGGRKAKLREARNARFANRIKPGGMSAGARLIQALELRKIWIGLFHRVTDGCVDHGSLKEQDSRGLKFAFEYPVVATLFQFERQSFGSRANDSAISQHVDEIGNDVLEQALVVRDDQLGVVWLFK